MNQNDINRLFTEKVTELIAQGFQINPATMSGSQGEFAKVDLRKGSEIIRVILTSQSNYRDGLDYLSLIVGRCSDQIRLDCFDSIGNTIWNNNLEVISEIKFARVANNYFTDMETGKEIQEKRYVRWKNKRGVERRILPEAFKSAALEYVRRQPRMKTCKLSEVESVTRFNCTRWGEPLPNLRGYKIVARGKTFFLRAPHEN